MKRKICVVTGTRAEYGLLYWLMKEIQEDSALELQIIATGMHLSPEFGLTYQVIEEDGFNIDARVEMLVSSDTPVGITKSIGLGLIGMADALERLRPDMMVLLGDRFEMMAAAQAAMVARIPIAHIAGGESTEGAIDEAIRHSISKMAHLHFASAEAYRKRLIQLGEHPRRIYNFGHTGLDFIRRLPLLSRFELETILEFNLTEKYFLVTYHPATLGDNKPAEVMQELFCALDQFPEAKIILTRPNADTGGSVIIHMLDEYAAKQPDRVLVRTSLGQLKYLSAMKHCSIVIGNSSSGIIEAPAMRKPSVNMGSRQCGRLKAASVIDCEENVKAIVEAIEKALSPAFQQEISGVESLYGIGNASYEMKQVLREIDLNGILMKHFYEVNFLIIAD